ncbi:hypothetical protein CJA_2318 [Cellvibrio japonicus Ueda107]|uniref:Uncharacterized protein n=1 Tax=Cellvibrio japonicus (strain Ueda107) TaxID=498211 RepID=B3PJV6_CELJU|nr:hypothetical protein CJA_2318 [Cellvibrio japonicus Ueda107]
MQIPGYGFYRSSCCAVVIKTTVAVALLAKIAVPF